MSFLFYIFATSICWGVGQTLVKKGLTHLTPWQSYALDTVVALFLWIPFGLYEGAALSSLTLPAILLGIYLGAVYALYYYVIEKGPISLITPIYNTAPVFTIIFSYFILKEVLSVPQLISIIITLIGILLISIPHSKKHIKDATSWIFLTVLLTIFSSLETIASKYVLTQSGDGILFILFALGQLTAVIIWFIIKPPKHIMPKIPARYFLPTSIGVILFNLGTITWVLALKTGLASVVAPLSNSYIVILIILSAWYLKEKIYKHQYIGIFLVIIGVIIVNIMSPTDSNTRTNKNAENDIKTDISPTAFPRQKAKVTYVFDGDTFALADGTRVRLIGIDAAEDNKYTPKQCFGKESTNMLSTLVLNQEIELETDTTDTDAYDRKLRYVYAEGIFINDWMVKQGYARVLSILPDTRYRTEFLASQQEAKKGLRGLWKACYN